MFIVTPHFQGKMEKHHEEYRYVDSNITTVLKLYGFSGVVSPASIYNMDMVSNRPPPNRGATARLETAALPGWKGELW